MPRQGGSLKKEECKRNHWLLARNLMKSESHRPPGGSNWKNNPIIPELDALKKGPQMKTSNTKSRQKGISNFRGMGLQNPKKSGGFLGRGGSPPVTMVVSILAHGLRPKR